MTALFMAFQSTAQIDARHPDSATPFPARPLLKPLASAMLALIGAGFAQAQSAPAATAAQAPVSAAAGSLPAITVTGQQAGDATTEGTGSFTTTAPVSTATRLGLTMRETPQSVTVITRERIEQQNLTDLTSVMEATTGVYVNHLDTQRYSYNVRGYTIDNYQVDGMLNTFSGSLKTDGDTAVYDRIEIVRGAAGLTTGAGDPSATVNQVRKRPTRQFQGNAAVSIGNHQTRRGEIDLSGPLAFDGKLRARFVAAKEQGNSFRPLYKSDRTAVYGIVEADLGPATTAAVGFEWQKNDPRGVTWGNVPYWNADGTVAHLPHNLNLSTPWARWGIDEKTTFATLEHRFNADWRLRAAASHAKRKEDSLLYFGFGGNPRPDGSGITVASGSFPGESTMKVADFNVDGKFSAFGRQHDVMFGWGWSRRDSESPAVRIGTDVPADYGVIPDWRTWTGDVPVLPVTVLPYQASGARIDQKAGYAATRLHLAEPLRLVLGARFGRYTSQTDSYTNGVLSTSTGYANKNIFTPYAGLLYDITPSWTAYASYTDIFKPQNYRDKNGSTLDPVVGKSIEAGIKGELFDKRMNVGAAVFRSKKSGVAEIDDSVPPNSLPDGGQAYRSTGKGNVVDGIELEASGQITRQWNVFAGFSHTRSRNANGDPINTVVPRNLLRLFTSYRFGEEQRWTVGGGISAQSSLWNTASKPSGSYNASGSPVMVPGRIDQGGVVTASLMAGYRINANLNASLHVNNLFDKKYYDRVGFYNGVYAATPRTVRLVLRGTF
jgi:outer membrane receptor for ferric coprogen and ferric-rhodotorulic acid